VPKPTLVVLGTGFGGFSLLRTIDAALYDIVVVSPRNHFLFTPLLPSTTVGTIEFRSIIEPIRAGSKRFRFENATCMSIDAERRTIVCRHAEEERTYEVRYDICVIAIGAVNNTWGVPGVKEHASFLRELSDARALRRKIIECFERAALPDLSAAERKRLLRFVVVGGGPTGVEYAAAVHDLIDDEVRKAFGPIAAEAEIVLLEASGQLLNTFDATLGDYTSRHFLRQHIDVRTKTIVVKVEADLVHLNDGEALPYGLLVWSTGNGPSPLVESLPFSRNRQKRVIVDDFLRVPGHAELYAFGDCASPEAQNFPATAQVAQQEGRYLGKALTALARGRVVKPFRYRGLGMLAYIGSNEAVADLRAIKGRGFATFLFWRSAYLTRLVSIKNKILVLFDWWKTIVFGRDVSAF